MVFRKIKNLVNSKSFIKITSINTKDNTVTFRFETSEDLEEYFKKDSRYIEYINRNLDLSSVPKSILAIPFISNILPIVWLFDCELIVDELDKTFYNAISNIRQKYCYMYPKASLRAK